MALRGIFIGANTGRGYEHFMEELRPAWARVCVVRGPVGAGRHLLLARLAEAWEAEGREVTRYCDPEDGTRLAAAVSGDWVVLDGAAPHRVECLPGDTVIDLGDALRHEAMGACREEAADLHRRMREMRRRAERCLRAADAAREDAAAVYAEATDAGTAYNLRLRLAQWLEGSLGETRRVFARAVTAEGVTGAEDALCREQTAHLKLPWGCDPDGLLYPLAVGLRVRGVGCVTAMQLLDGGRLAHLATDTHAIVTETAEEDWALKFDSAVLRREQQALRFDRAAYDLWIGQAVEALRGAREARNSLERLAADALDRDRQEEMIARASRCFR